MLTLDCLTIQFSSSDYLGLEQHVGGPNATMNEFSLTRVPAIVAALKQLGITRTFLWESMGVAPNHQTVWKELLECKYDSTHSISESKFEAILHNFDDVRDWATSIVKQGILDKHPSLKVILTVRTDARTWYNSFHDTIWHYQKRKYCPQSFSDFLIYGIWTTRFPRTGQSVFSTRFMRTRLRQFIQDGEQWYHDFNDQVRSLIPANRLIVFESKQGWAPLCEFLGRKVPTSEFPHRNQVQTFRSVVDNNWDRMVRKRFSELARWTSWGMACVALLFAALYWRECRKT